MGTKPGTKKIWWVESPIIFFAIIFLAGENAAKRPDLLFGNLFEGKIT